MAALFISLGFLALKTGLQKVSYMEKLKRRGIEPVKNFSRSYFLFLAIILLYVGFFFLQLAVER